jgi:hypothetical protein
MQRGWLPVMVRCPAAVLVAQGRLGHVTCNRPGFTYRHVCKRAMALRLRLARKRQKNPFLAAPS